MIGLRFFPLKSADIRRAGTRDEPPKNVCVGGYSCFIFYVFSSMLRRLVSDISISFKTKLFHDSLLHVNDLSLPNTD